MPSIRAVEQDNNSDCKAALNLSI